jgi:tRNA modification GTPase
LIKPAHTIFALASGRLPSAVAVIRLSGPQTRFALETIGAKPLEARRMHLRLLRTQDGRLLDQCMMVFFPGPRSETGEDCGEIHLHGGRSVVSAVSGALLGMGLRVAEPGEFSKRAFLNGKTDLLQAEAVADLVAAETEAQRHFAAENLAGRQSELYAAWRGRLLHARAMIEADLDFSDEGDVPGSVADRIWSDMANLRQEIAAHLDGFSKAAVLRDGFEVVIAGPPNAGKSSLLNALARQEVAIVSEEPGTTRDLIEVPLDLGGVKIRLVDTAGLRAEPAGGVERLGIDRAQARASRADLVLSLVDLSRPEEPFPLRSSRDIIKVGNKLDLVPSSSRAGFDSLISAALGTGLQDLLLLLQRKASSAIGAANEVLPSRQRHVEHLQRSSEHLAHALEARSALELRAEELRLAAVALGRITGEIATEDVLGAIFSSFCIGK